MGALIYGEDISSIEDSHVSEIANVAISIHRADEPETQNDPQFQYLFSNEKTIITRTNGARTISGCVLIKDINSNPAIIMQVDQDRDIYRQGQNVEYLFLASSLTAFNFAGLWNHGSVGAKRYSSFEQTNWIC